MVEIKEAFVYMWYDSLNKMYYVGKHKGTPDDNYGQSSSLLEWSRFDDAPPHFKRRILFSDTDSKCAEEESRILKNRKAKCWNRYYNVSTATSTSEGGIVPNGIIPDSLISPPSFVLDSLNGIKTPRSKDNKKYKSVSKSAVWSEVYEMPSLGKGVKLVRQPDRSSNIWQFRMRDKKAQKMVRKSMKTTDLEEAKKRATWFHETHMFIQLQKEEKPRIRVPAKAVRVLGVRV